MPDVGSQISISMDKLENELPPEKFILGAFHKEEQSPAFTSRVSFERVLGLVLIATTVEASELENDSQSSPRPVIWMRREGPHHSY